MQLTSVASVVNFTFAVLLSVVPASKALAEVERPTTTSTTSTTLMSEDPEDGLEERNESLDEPAGQLTAKEPVVAALGSCAARFFLETEGAWLDLRLIAAYDRRLGSFKSTTERVNCSRSRTFESGTFENHYGVLQVSLSNAESLMTVSGPVELFSCEFGYGERRPTLDDFILQVQAAHTIVPIERHGHLPEVSMSLSCAKPQ